ncbi:hypothetical protein [Actinomadura sp. NTSP31]|uniref:hypothetical protein n=1 Tax=Actinomadura sp. NTSP31 TaxID=1735447 RepID=UPI0035C13DA6
MHTASVITAAVRPTSGPAVGKASRSRGRTDIADRPCDRRTALETAHALTAAERSFAALVQGPAPLTVDGAALGRGLPARPIDLLELRAILLHPATCFDTRDHVWRDLVTQARRHGSDWIIGCVGVALPGLKAVVRDRLVHLDYDPEVGTARVAGDLVTAFYHALLRVDLNRPKVAQRLVSQSAQTVVRAYRPKVRTVPVDPYTMAELDPSAASTGGHPEMLLDSAVRQGVITAQDAEIIAVTRLEKVPPAELAERLGTSYTALMKRRRRAELRLVEAMRDEGLRDDIEYLMSTTGV